MVNLKNLPTWIKIFIVSKRSDERWLAEDIRQSSLRQSSLISCEEWSPNQQHYSDLMTSVVKRLSFPTNQLSTFTYCNGFLTQFRFPYKQTDGAWSTSAVRGPHTQPCPCLDWLAVRNKVGHFWKSPRIAMACSSHVFFIVKNKKERGFEVPYFLNPNVVIVILNRVLWSDSLWFCSHIFLMIDTTRDSCNTPGSVATFS